MKSKTQGGKEFSLSEIMEKICQLSAQAVFRYCEVAGTDPGEDLPEYFIQSYVFNKLGSELTITLETSFKKLQEWNSDARGRHGLYSQAPSDESLEALIETIVGQRRVDMVVFRGEQGNKNLQDLWALVEFKRHSISLLDRQKLLAILDQIDTCPAGAICSVVDDSPESKWLQREREAAEKEGEGWFVYPVPILPHDPNRRFSACIRYFPARNRTLNQV